MNDGESRHRRTDSSKGKTLKLAEVPLDFTAGSNALFPARSRFNEDVNSIISENKQKMAAPVLRERNLAGVGGDGPADGRS